MTPTLAKTAIWILPDTQTAVNELYRTSTVVKTAFWILFNTQTGMNKLHKTSTVVKNVAAQASQNIDSGFEGPSWHSNRRIRASQDLHSGENCIQGPSWHSYGPAWVSHDLNSSENGFLDPFQHSNWHEQTSQDLHSGKNLPARALQNLDCVKKKQLSRSFTQTVVSAYWILTLKQACTSFSGPQQWWKLLSGPSWRLNRCVRASQDLHSGENCLVDISEHLQTPAQASYNLHSSEECFLDFSWHSDRPAQASQDLRSGQNCFQSPYWHTSFARPPQRWKLLPTSFLALKVARQSLGGDGWKCFQYHHNSSKWHFINPPKNRLWSVYQSSKIWFCCYH